MGTINKTYTFSANTLAQSEQVNQNFDDILNGINGGLSNSNIASDASIAGTKLDLTKGVFANEHNGTTGAHTGAFSRNDMRNCRLKNGSTAASQIDIDADSIDVFTTADVCLSLSDVDLTVDITASGANGLMSGDSEAATTWFYIWVIAKADETTAGMLSSSATTVAELTFPTGYTYGKLVGAVYNDSSQDFEAPVPVVGAAFEGSNAYPNNSDTDVALSPLFSMFKVGSYTGDGGALKLVTGVGFKPDYVVVQQNYNGAAAVHRSASMGAAQSFMFDGTELSNGILAFISDGFGVGANDRTNYSGTTYFYMAWKNSYGIKA